MNKGAIVYEYIFDVARKEILDLPCIHENAFNITVFSVKFQMTQFMEDSCAYFLFGTTLKCIGT